MLESATTDVSEKATPAQNKYDNTVLDSKSHANGLGSEVNLADLMSFDDDKSQATEHNGISRLEKLDVPSLDRFISDPVDAP